MFRLLSGHAIVRLDIMETAVSVAMHATPRFSVLVEWLHRLPVLGIRHPWLFRRPCLRVCATWVGDWSLEISVGCVVLDSTPRLDYVHLALRIHTVLDPVFRLRVRLVWCRWPIQPHCMHVYAPWGPIHPCALHARWAGMRIRPIRLHAFNALQTAILCQWEQVRVCAILGITVRDATFATRVVGVFRV